MACSAPAQTRPCGRSSAAWASARTAWWVRSPVASCGRPEPMSRPKLTPSLRSAIMAQQLQRGAVLLRRGGSGHKVRNVTTGRVLPCCWMDCERDGDKRHQVMIDHEQPRWPGEQRVYIFCGSVHKQQYLNGTPMADKA